jgi:hypothetical protein
VRRYAGSVLLLAIAAAVGAVLVANGGDDPPPRLIAHVRMDQPPVVDALVKAAEQARFTGGDVDALLERLRATQHLDVHLPELRRGDVTLRDVVLLKDGPQASAQATVDEAAIAEYLPQGVSVRYDPKAGGEGIVFTGTTTLLGVKVPVTARALAVDGAVVVVPEGLPIGRTTLFADPRLRVERLTAKRVKGGLRVRVEGTLVG